MKIFTYILISIFSAACLLWQTQAPAQALESVISSSSLIGPRQNIATGTPSAYGFWSFSRPKPGVLSRSGQPTMAEFQWLKAQGTKSIINLRFDNEYQETADDGKLPGFNQLGFNYLHLPIRDGGAPNNKQAKEFLKFVTQKSNQPVHIHCRGGYGRTGAMVALFRYEIDKWPMAKAIAESRLYHGGVSTGQKKWLLAWAKKNNFQENK